VFHRGGKSIGPCLKLSKISKCPSRKFFEFPENISPRKKERKDNCKNLIDKRRNSEEKF
jgi:hypothetical protein